MEAMKRFEEITQPDHLSTGFGMIDVSDETSRNMTLGDFYKDAENLRVNEGAPEDVRSYIEAVKTLFVYGWFYYPFFTLSAFMATTAVEMALKQRLQTRPNDPSGLKTLFDIAISQGLLRDEGFPSHEHVKANRVAIFGENTEPSEGLPEEAGPTYAERVAGLMRHFRNVFAHPSGHWILLPGQALDFLVLAGEVINQLWPLQTAG